MANLRNTSTGGLAKYITPVVAMIHESMKGVKRLKTTVVANNILVKPTDANEKILLEWQNLASATSTEGDAKELVLETDKGDVKFGQLWKPNVNVNMGDMAEGVFGAAIAARFKSKNRPITLTDVFDVLEEFSKKATWTIKKQGKKGKRGVITFDSPNKNPKVVDKVTLTIALAEVNMKGLLDPQAKLSLMTVASGSVAYANGTIVMGNAELVYENNIFNQINVVADGLSGQRKTKVDVYVEIGNKQIDPERVDINVSLKARSTNLVGQVGGNEFEKQETLWGNLLGSLYKAVVGGIKDPYDTLLQANDPIKAMTLSYKTVQTQLDKDFKNSAKQKQILENLAHGISYYSTLNDPTVSLVQLKGDDARIYSFEGLQAELSLLKFRAEMKYSKVTRGLSAGRELPTVEILKESTLAGDKYPHDDLLKIRTKIEYKGSELYFRNYVEKGKLLSDLIGSYAREV